MRDPVPKPSPFTQPDATLEVVLESSYAADFDLTSKTFRLVDAVSRRPVDITPAEPQEPCPDPAGYLIALPGIGSIYVGQTKNLAGRMKTHRSRKQPVKEALARAASMYDPARDQQTGAELHRLTGFFRYLTVDSFDAGGDVRPIRRGRPLILQDLNDRLLLESAALRTLREQWPKSKLINAETGHRVQ
jgi:hypothetical protein